MIPWPKNIWNRLGGFLAVIFAILISSCAKSTPETVLQTSLPTTAAYTKTPTLTNTRTSNIITPNQATITPTISHIPSPRTLTICVGAIPDTLYIYGGNMLAMSNVLEAIYDGPIDTLKFDFQPVILVKLPDIADGDAVIKPVPVKEGELIVNDAGNVVQLGLGEKVRPVGCRSSACAQTWGGESLEMDQLSATFTLLDGLKWSDGEPLTASDSVFSYHIAQECDDPMFGSCGTLGQGGRATLERTADYKGLDERTTQWVGLPGFIDPYYATNFAHPLPYHELLGYSFQELFEVEETSLHPLGWGPYMIQEVHLDRRPYYIQMQKNPHYFRAAEGLPKFDELIFRFVGEDSAQNVADLLQGKCDLVERNAHIDDWFDKLVEMDGEGLLQLHASSGTVWEHADFNLRPVKDIVNTGAFAGWDLDGDGLGPFGDVRLRKAIALCMDRQRIVDEVFAGRSAVVDSYLPNEHLLFDPGVSHYGFDPESAMVLLDEMGWIDEDGNPITPRISQGVLGVPDGTLLAFSFETTSAFQRRQATQILAESLAQCGIKAILAYYPAEEWFADGPKGKLFGRKFDLGQYASISYAIPDCCNWQSEYVPGDPSIMDANNLPLHPFGWMTDDNLPANVGGYSNPEFDAACKITQELLPGEIGYEENFQITQEIFARDLPIIPLYMRLKVTATRADMCGFWIDASANSDTWNIEMYDFGDGCNDY